MYLKCLNIYGIHMHVYPSVSCIICNFYLVILKIMFLFFKNTVKILKFRLTFYHFRKS